MYLDLISVSQTESNILSLQDVGHNMLEFSCLVNTPTEMNCVLPQIPQLWNSADSRIGNRTVEYRYGFIMDDIEVKLKISHFRSCLVSNIKFNNYSCSNYN